MKYPIALASVVISLEMFSFGSHYNVAMSKSRTGFSATLTGKYEDAIMHSISNEAVLEILQFAESTNFYDLCSENSKIGDEQLALRDNMVVLREQPYLETCQSYWTIAIETNSESFVVDYSTDEISWRFTRMAEFILQKSGFSIRELEEVM